MSYTVYCPYHEDGTVHKVESEYWDEIYEIIDACYEKASLELRGAVEAFEEPSPVRLFYHELDMAIPTATPYGNPITNYNEDDLPEMGD